MGQSPRPAFDKAPREDCVAAQRSAEARQKPCYILAVVSAAIFIVFLKEVPCNSSARAVGDFC